MVIKSWWKEIHKKKMLYYYYKKKEEKIHKKFLEDRILKKLENEILEK